MTVVSFVERTATAAWAPAQMPTPLLALGTVAGALDASFSTDAVLEMFELSTKDEAPNLAPVAKINSSARFNRLAWGLTPDAAARPLGILAGGLENGDLALWDPNLMRASPAKDSLIVKPFRHKGPVKGLDFNSVDVRFLASGSSDGEIFVWDLANPTVSKPYAPGASRSMRLEDITAVAWNKLYHYILAAASNNGNTVIYDLRSRNEIASFSHPGGRKQISSISWNPDSPTQIATASDDDAAPAILMWDLRNSRAPERTLAGHSRGVLSLGWCTKDSSLLISCAKDNRTIVWDLANANSTTGSEAVGDLHRSTNWSFEVAWCQRNPDLVTVSGFDGIVSVHSLQGNGAGSSERGPNEADAAASSALFQDPHAFITGGGFGSGPSQNQGRINQYSDHKFSLPRPPKWLKKPAGCSWGFGARLVTFGRPKSTSGSGNDLLRKNNVVSIRNVVSEPAFVSRAIELDRVGANAGVQGGLATSEFSSFCQNMAESLADPKQSASISSKDKDLWKFMSVMFEVPNSQQILQYLGYDRAEISNGNERLNSLLQKLLAQIEVPNEIPDSTVVNGDGHVEGDDEPVNRDDAFAMIAAQNKISAQPILNTPATASIPFKLYSTMQSETTDTDALVMKSLVLGNFEAAIRICFGAKRLADALAFAVCSGSTELMQFAQQQYFKAVQNEKAYARVLNNIMQGDLYDLVDHAQIDGEGTDWKDIAALVCMYGKPEDLPALLSTLGRRLESASTAPASLANLKSVDWKARDEKKFAAVLCFMASGDLSKVLNSWVARETEEEKALKAIKSKKNSPLVATPKSLALQGLIEKVQVFRCAIGFVDHELQLGSLQESSYSLESLYKKYIEYAQTSSAQGLVNVAWKILQLVPDAFSSQIDFAVLKDRLYNSGLVEASVAHPPQFPFEFQDIVGKPVPAAVTQRQHQQAYGGFQQSGYQSSAAIQGNLPVSEYSNGYSAYNSTSPIGAVPPQPAYGQPVPSSIYGAPNNLSFPPVSNSFPIQPQQTYPPPASTSGFTPPAPSAFAPSTAGYTRPSPSAFVPPPVAARSVSHSSQYSQPVPQPAGSFRSHAGISAPQPTGSVPPIPQQQAVDAGPKRYPSGDRSHIPAGHMQIVSGLDSLMSSCKEIKSQSAQPQQRKEWEDTEKKMLNLFDQMNNGEVAEDVVTKLNTIVKCDAAHKIQVELLTTRFATTSLWIVGVKRVIDILERSHLDKSEPVQPATSAGYIKYNSAPPPSTAGTVPIGSGLAPPQPPRSIPAVSAANTYNSGFAAAASTVNSHAPPPPPPKAAPPPPPAATNPYGGRGLPPAPAGGNYGAPPPAGFSNLPNAGYSQFANSAQQPYGPGYGPPVARPSGAAVPPPPPAAGGGFGGNVQTRF
ncbi:protein transport protein S31 [Entophlyctis luteolus]|nr:protein transport protein S31 [Entophlyctis luteolus]